MVINFDDEIHGLIIASWKFTKLIRDVLKCHCLTQPLMV